MITLGYKVDLPLQNDYRILLFSLELTVNPVVNYYTVNVRGPNSFTFNMRMYSGIELCWHRE